MCFKVGLRRNLFGRLPATSSSIHVRHLMLAISKIINWQKRKKPCNICVLKGQRLDKRQNGNV